MTIIYYTHFQQRSIEWHAKRCGKLTGSVLNKILTPAKLQLSAQAAVHADVLACERIKGVSEPMPVTADMERGTMTEAEAVYHYEKRYGQVEEIAFMENTDLPFAFGCSPDGLIDNRRGGLEAKCPRAANHLKTLLDNKIKGEYTLQMQGGMLAGNLEYFDFVSFNEGMKFNKIRVMRCETTTAAITAAGTAFEEMIQERVIQYHQTHGFDTPLPEEDKYAA